MLNFLKHNLLMLIVLSIMMKNKLLLKNIPCIKTRVQKHTLSMMPLGPHIHIKPIQGGNSCHLLILTNLYLLFHQNFNSLCSSDSVVVLCFSQGLVEFYLYTNMAQISESDVIGAHLTFCFLKPTKRV